MADIDELGRFSMELSRIAPRVALGIAPFVAKRNTPLDGAAFESIDVLDAKLARLRAGGLGPGDAAPDVAQVGLGRVPPGAGGPRRRARRRAGGAGGRALRRLEGGPRGGPRARRQRSAGRPSVANGRDRVDFDQGALGQARRLNGRARGQRCAEVARIDLVDRAEVLEIGEKYRRLDD